MNKQFMMATFGWGFLLWLVGYILGIVFFMIVPPSLVGWVIMPIGILMTLWVLYKKVRLTRFQDYLKLAAIWTILAMVCDYFFLVKVFKPVDGYYKLDVYLYYLITFLLPLIVGWRKNKKS
jgi:uncharacterized membrane protein